MWILELPFETWRAIIDAWRAQGLPYMLEHDDILEQKLDLTPADQALVRMSLTDDVFLRSVSWACWQLGLLMPTERRQGAFTIQWSRRRIA